MQRIDAIVCIQEDLRCAGTLRRKEQKTWVDLLGIRFALRKAEKDFRIVWFNGAYIAYSPQVIVGEYAAMYINRW